MKNITPCLWFDNEGEEAAKFYVSVFPNSKIKHVEKYVVDTPSNKPIGSVMTVTFEIAGSEFMALNGGPYFKLNPSVSFLVVCKNKNEVNDLWGKLSNKGKILMELGEYPFSKWYGWANDKYGVSWQIILDDGHYKYKHKITPTLMFVGNVAGRAEEAMKLYASTVPNSKVGEIARYPKGMEPEKEGTVMHGAVILDRQEFFAMDSAGAHEFNFNEAVSLMIPCKDQKEMDYYYDKLSADPQAEVCGWLKDKFGVSWQLNPVDYDKMMQSLSLEKNKRVMKALLEMKRLDMNKLKNAAEGK